MANQQHSDTKYRSDANKIAPKGVQLIELCKALSRKLKALRNELNDWRKALKDAPVVTFMIFLPLSLIAELLVSYDLYHDLLPNGNSITVFVICAALMLTGAFITSYLIEGRFEGMKELALLNERKKYPKQVISVLEEEITEKNRKRFFWGVVLFLVLGTVILSLSFYRLQHQNGDTETLGWGEYVKAFLVILLFVFEIIFGVYLIISLKIIGRCLSIWFHQSAENAHAEKRNIKVNQVVDLENDALKNGEVTPPSAALLTVLDYHYNNSTASGSTLQVSVEEMQIQRHTITIYVFDVANKPIGGAYVVGKLSDGKTTQTVLTNPVGLAILTWTGENSRLDCIAVGEQIFPGAYKAGTTVPFVLSTVETEKVLLN